MASCPSRSAHGRQAQRRPSARRIKRTAVLRLDVSTSFQTSQLPDGRSWPPNSAASVPLSFNSTSALASFTKSLTAFRQPFSATRCEGVCSRWSPVSIPLGSSHLNSSAPSPDPAVCQAIHTWSCAWVANWNFGAVRLLVCTSSKFTFQIGFSYVSTDMPFFFLMGWTTADIRRESANRIRGWWPH